MDFCYFGVLFKVKDKGGYFHWRIKQVYSFSLKVPLLPQSVVFWQIVINLLCI